MVKYINKVGILVLSCLIILFIAIEWKGLFHYDNTDENGYFYMSYLVSEGKLPYRDFFYAHPPVELLFGAVIFKLFGFSIFLLKLIPFSSIIGSAILLFLVTRNYFGDSSAILASSFFLFSYRVMAEATYFLGLNLALLFLMLGFYFISKRPVLAGIFFALAGMTRLLVLVPVAVILAFMLIKNLKVFLKATVSFIAVFGVANLALSYLSPDFILSVYKFHLLKPSIEGNSAELLLGFIIQNPLLVAAALLAFLVWSNRLVLFAAASVFSILFLLSLSRIFNFYFLVALPFLAVVAGVSMDSVLKKISYNKYAIAAVVLIFAVSAAISANQLLAFDFAEFSAGREMAEYVSANSAGSQFIFGDETSVPLVALLSKRKIMNDIVDTNDLVYLSGVRDLDAELEMIRNEKPRFVIIRPLYGIGALEGVKAFLDNNCRLEKHFKDPYWSDFLVYGC